MNKSKGLAGGDYRKVMITLTPQQEAFLDTIRNEIKARKGHSLSRTEIIRALVDYLATLDLSSHFRSWGRTTQNGPGVPQSPIQAPFMRINRRLEVDPGGR